MFMNNQRQSNPFKYMPEQQQQNFFLIMRLRKYNILGQFFTFDRDEAEKIYQTHKRQLQIKFNYKLRDIALNATYYWLQKQMINEGRVNKAIWKKSASSFQEESIKYKKNEKLKQQQNKTQSMVQLNQSDFIFIVLVGELNILNSSVVTNILNLSFVQFQKHFLIFREKYRKRLCLILQYFQQDTRRIQNIEDLNLKQLIKMAIQRNLLSHLTSNALPLCKQEEQNRHKSNFLENKTSI